MTDIIGTNSSVADYLALMKPRVMSLVIFTAFCGLYIAPGTIHPIIAICAILFISMGAGAAAVINMWYDRDIDAVMQRTQKRPIVVGLIEPREALTFGIIIGIIAVLLMGLCVNVLSGALLAIAILYYVFVYTIWLKRTSVYNVVIGGVSGALPPVIGWAAVSNDISLQSLSLFAIIFAWTPPHSWALALFRMQDYKNCAVPMMPVIKGEPQTKKQILAYTLLMLATSYLPYVLDMTWLSYAIVATVLGLIFLFLVIKLFLVPQKTIKSAKQLFVYSIFYLFAIFASLVWL